VERMICAFCCAFGKPLRAGWTALVIPRDRYRPRPAGLSCGGWGSRCCPRPGDGMTSRRLWCRASQAQADACAWRTAIPPSACPAGSRTCALCASEPGPGVLAYVDGKTAGWCSVAPKSACRALVSSRTIPHVQDGAAWPVACFVVRPGFRRRGLMHELPEGARRACACDGRHRGGRLPGRPWQRARRPGQRLPGYRPALRGTRFSRVCQTTGRRGGKPRWLVRRDLS
jgi:hypothetical protein